MMPSMARFRHVRFAALLLAFALAAAGCHRRQPALTEANRLFLPNAYASAYRGHPRYAAWCAEIQRALVDFPARYREATGIECGGYRGIDLRIQDEELRLGGGDREIGGMTDYHQGRVRVRLSVPVTIGAPGEVYTLVLHEMTHAVQRRDVNSGADWSACWPMWFREGLAVWISRDMAFKIDNIGLLELYMGRDPGKGLIGLTPTDGSQHYAEWALAIDTLERIRPGRLGTLIQWLMLRRHLKKGIHEIYGLPYEEFAALAGARAAAVMRDRFPEDAVLAFLEARQLAAKPDPVCQDEAMRIYQALRAGPESAGTAIGSTVLWEIGMLNAKRNRPAAAVSYYRQLITEAPHDPQVSNCLYNIGRCFQVLGCREAARGQFRAVKNRYVSRARLVEWCEQRLGEIDTMEFKTAN